jgi:hypothetical protein
MLHIKRIGKNKARIVLPRHYQFILDLDSGEMGRIPDKPFPTQQEIEELGENRIIEGIFDLYESEEHNEKD